MANINADLNQISYARYGKEVRNSISHALYEVNNETTQNTNDIGDLRKTVTNMQIGGGNAEVELADYYTKKQADGKFALKSDIPEIGNDVVTSEQLEEKLNGYYTEVEADVLFVRADGGNLPIPDEVVTTENLNERLPSDVVRDEDLENYYTTEQVKQNFALKINTYTKMETDEKFLLKNEIPTIPDDIVRETDLENYYTKQQADAKFALIGGAGTGGATSEEIRSIIDTYLKADENNTFYFGVKDGKYGFYNNSDKTTFIQFGEGVENAINIPYKIGASAPEEKNVFWIDTFFSTAPSLKYYDESAGRWEVIYKTPDNQNVLNGITAVDGHLKYNGNPLFNTASILDYSIGTIISVMGNEAPEGFLKCNGATYEIASYPKLAEYFKEQFGSSNYFGGNGISTFGVPNLQGEFLRGAGENSHSQEGSGGLVGQHQSSTKLQHIGANISVGDLWTQTITPTDNDYSFDHDYVITSGTTGKGYYYRATGTFAGSTNIAHISTRPTNTSVLYCIKAEPTPLKMSTVKGAQLYDRDEIVIGKWVDGRPLYRKVFYNLINMSSAHSNWVTVALPVSNINELIRLDGFLKGTTHDLKFNTFHATGYEVSVGVNNNVNLLYRNLGYTGNTTILILEYTKSTDEADSFDIDMVTGFSIKDEVITAAVNIDKTW